MNLTLKNRRRYGGYIIHFSIVLMFIGFTGNAFNKEASQHLAKGQGMNIGDYSIKMAGSLEGHQANYSYRQAILDVYKDGKLIRTLKPEQRTYETSENQTLTNVALHSTPKEDLYTVLAGVSEDGSVCEIKAYVNPLVFWFWFGGAVMFFGTVIAATSPQSMTAKN
jgi:cytochrome c-type biogenesis protein CcmF